MFDSLVAAAVAPSNANHRLPLLAQPLSLSRLGVALIIFGGSPAKRKGARRRVGGHAQFSCAGAGGDPAAPDERDGCCEW